MQGSISTYLKVLSADHVMAEPQHKSSWPPVSAEEFAEWFDSDGRLVKEVTMRQRVFEGAAKLPSLSPFPYQHFPLFLPLFSISPPNPLPPSLPPFPPFPPPFPLRASFHPFILSEHLHVHVLQISCSGCVRQLFTYMHGSCELLCTFISIGANNMCEHCHNVYM